MKSKDAAKIMKAHQYLYYCSTPVWADWKYDKFCEANGLDGGGGSDVKSHYSADEIALAEQILNSARKERGG